jgi:hypothetical protein
MSFRIRHICLPVLQFPLSVSFNQSSTLIFIQDSFKWFTHDVTSLNKLGTFTTLLTRNKSTLTVCRPRNIPSTMPQCKCTQTCLFGIQYGKPQVQRHLRHSAVGFETADTRGEINWHDGCTSCHWCSVASNTALKWRCNSRKTYPNNLINLNRNLDTCPSEHYNFKSQRNYSCLVVRTAMTLATEEVKDVRYLSIIRVRMWRIWWTGHVALMGYTEMHVRFYSETLKLLASI